MASKKRKNKNCNIEKLLQFLNEKAELMRLKPTKWELTLKTHLEHLGYRFKNQFPIICKKKYGYIMDFVLLDYNIFIECNSVKYHYSSKEQIKKDNIRSKRIQKEGYFPIVLTNKQIDNLTSNQIRIIIETKISLLKVGK